MHSVKYAYIEVYFSINNENILEQKIYKVFRRFYDTEEIKMSIFCVNSLSV